LVTRINPSDRHIGWRLFSLENSAGKQATNIIHNKPGATAEVKLGMIAKTYVRLEMETSIEKVVVTGYVQTSGLAGLVAV
jgi:hypothetical protein